MKLNKVLLMTMILLVMVLAACSDKESAGSAESSEAAKDNLNTDGEFPIVNEEITLDFFAGKTAPSNDDWNDVMIFYEYEEMTNIDINWEMVPLNSLDEKRNLALASGHCQMLFIVPGCQQQIF